MTELTAKWYADNGWKPLKESDTYKEWFKDGMTLISESLLEPRLEQYSAVLVVSRDEHGQYWLCRFFPSHEQRWAHSVDIYSKEAGEFIKLITSQKIIDIIQRTNR